MITMLACLSPDAIHEEGKQVLRIFTISFHLIPYVRIVGNTLLEEFDVRCDCILREVSTEAALLFTFFNEFPQ